MLAVGAALFMNQNADMDDGGTSQVKRQQLSRKNAVLVFGATGRTGKLIVKALLQAGRTVIAACRSSQAASKAWGELGVKDGKQDGSGGILFTETGVDITNPKTLKKQVFAGATQVVVAVGPVRNQDGKPGYSEQMSSERVDGEGVSNIAQSAAKQLPKASLVVDPLMRMSDFADWEQKNDTVMGGKSSSEVSDKDGGASVCRQTSIHALVSSCASTCHASVLRCANHPSQHALYNHAMQVQDRKLSSGSVAVTPVV